MRMFLLMMLALTLGLWACSEQPEPAAPEAADEARATERDHAGHDHAPADDEPATDADLKRDADAIAEAGAADAAAPVCVVSGEPLGSMGDPAEVTVKGQTVQLCCPMCEPTLRKDPDKYLARLDQAKAGTLDVNADETDGEDDHANHDH